MEKEMLVRVFAYIVGVLEYRNAIDKEVIDRYGLKVQKPGLGLHRR